MFRLPQVPEGISSRAYFAGLLGPIVLVSTLGVQLTLTLALLVPPPVRRIDGYTFFGGNLYLPERDPIWYLAGLAAGLAGGLMAALVWRRRAGSAGTDLSQPRLLGTLGFQLALALAGTSVFLSAFYRDRGVFGVDKAVPKAFLVTALVVAAVSAIAAVTYRIPRNKGSRERPLDKLGTYEHARLRFSVADLVTPVGIVLLAYIPLWRQVAGVAFLSETLFHWDFYAMGPALGFRHGGALGTEIYVLYGVGWPMLFRAVFSWLPVSYGRLIQVGSLFSCLYLAGAYVLLRILVRRPLLAAAGALLLVMQLALGTQGGPIWNYPSLTFMRWPFDVFVFVAIVAYSRTGRRVWALAVGTLIGLELLFALDTGIYLAASVGAWWLGTLVVVPDRRRHFIDSVLSAAAALGALLAGLGVASRGTFLQAAFWNGLLETLRQFSDGWGQLPLATFPRPLTLGFFVALVTFQLIVLSYCLVRLLHREASQLDLFRGCLAAYGLLLQSKFVGYSLDINAYRHWIPAALIAVTLVDRADFHLGEYLKTRWNPRKAAVASLAPYAASGLALLLVFVAAPRVLAEPLFRYPNLLTAAVKGREPDGLCLTEVPKDICGLPSTLAESVDEYRVVADRLKEFGREGKRVAILDTSGYQLYVTSDTAPWGRYARLFDTLIRTEQVDRAVELLEGEPPDLILTRKPPGPGSELWSFALGPFPNSFFTDTADRLFQVVRRDFRIEQDIGPFLVWSRAEPGDPRQPVPADQPVIVGR